MLKNAIKMALLFPNEVIALYPYVYMSVCLCVCIYVCVCTYTCPCTYTHTSPGVYVYIYGYLGCLQKLRGCMERRKLILEAVFR